MNSLKNFFGFFFGFKGRIGRLHYALFLLVLAVNYLFASMILELMNIGRVLYNNPTTRYTEYLVYLSAIFALLIVLKYSLIIRRIHDFNEKATGNKLFQAILWTDILSLFNLSITYEMKHFVNLAMTVISISCLIILAFKKGDIKENDFGKPQIPFWKKTNS
ncbi:DUF805 domain-containing protein [Mannheimia pernigra]|uniref:DUF805 domain-containing protein n=1 Tax=Mannheimia pernigra TaxID=111844 RepID=UPI0013175422|nr:DUF805 domain-containing protein [Mannheimia pernigra]QHB17367.1 DUF805 domain-containing protein [Mannheimia pernigra]